MYVKALFEFTAEPDTPEISLFIGEILTLTRPDSGDGWCEGTNSQGQTGLFPANYVEEINQDNDESDDEWVHGFSTETNNDNVSIASSTLSLDKSSSSASVGAEPKISGSICLESDKDKIYITESNNRCNWSKSSNSYSVTVEFSKLEKKLGGIKSFVAYKLTPSFTGIVVSRRYKHFDWLHERLHQKYLFLGIPPLPDKQIANRYEEVFIENRRAQLQEFVNWMCRHPVLSRSEVWLHFLTCTEEKKWKAGKRIAEKDTFIGINFCASIIPPQKSSADFKEIDESLIYYQKMDTSIKILKSISSDQIKKFQFAMKNDMQEVGNGFSDLALSLEIDERQVATNYHLSKSVGHVAGVLIKIALLYGDKPKYDWIPFSNSLHLYSGVVASQLTAFNAHKNAMIKKKDYEKLAFEQKITQDQLQEFNRRHDNISYILLAEFDHFRQERNSYFREAISKFLAGQILFYKKVIEQYEIAQKLFES